MAVIYLSHPKHGVKIATMEMEAQHDEQNGWQRFDPDAEADSPSVDFEPVSDPVNVMPEPRRRGRPRVEVSN